MDPSNDAMIMEDLGRFLPEKLQRLVGTEKTYNILFI